MTFFPDYEKIISIKEEVKPSYGRTNFVSVYADIGDEFCRYVGGYNDKGEYHIGTDDLVGKYLYEAKTMLIERIYSVGLN